MFRVLTCLTTEHDWRLVAVAGLICFLASIAAISLFHRARATYERARAIWTVTAGAAAGCGIWATHFIAMLAYDPGINTAYDIGLTALSLIMAVAITAAGLGVAVYSQARAGAAIGGGIVGAGVACMHYLGMWALELPGRVTWLPELVVVSIALGMIFGMAALAVAVRWDGIRETAGAALLLTLAILSHHFTAMGAVEIVPDPTQLINIFALSPSSLALTVAGAAVAILGMALIVAFADRRSEKKMFEQNVRLDAALHNMRQGLLMFDSEGRLVLFNQRYLEMYGLATDTVKVGYTLVELLRLRKSVGTFNGDPDQYAAKLADYTGKFRGDPDTGKFVGEGIETKVTEIPDGRSISVTNQSMQGGGWVSTHSDITEMRDAERELGRTRTFLDAVVENVPVTLVVKNADDRRYVLINRAGEKFFGLSREEVIGKTSDEIFSKEEADAIKRRDEELLQSTSEIFLEDHPLMTPRQGTRLVNTKKVTIRGHDGAPRYLVNVIEDVTEKRRGERELDRTRTFLDTVVENVPVTLIVKNADDRRYVLINRSGEDLLGVPREELLGKTAYDFYPKEVADIINARDDELAGGSELLTDEHPTRLPRRGIRLLSTTRLAIKDDNGEPRYLLRVIEDITERKRAEARIEYMSHYDGLTDLPNRVAFSERLTSTLQRAASTKGTFAVLYIDLDRFMKIKNIFGNSIGDPLLCEVARRLQSAAEGAFLARVGGHKFAAIIEGPQPAAAQALAGRLLAIAEKEIEIGDHLLQIGITVGGAIFPTDGADETTLLHNLDAAFYQAKEESRGSVRFFEADMDRQLRDQRALQLDLRSAAGCGELELYYQPQTQIAGAIVGFEALLRWHHPTRGLVPPGIFIPVAEESGLITAIGEWVLRDACREAASWPRPLRVAINLSPIQFQQGDLPTLVHSVLLETGLAAERLEFEITENVLIGDFSRTVSILRRLKLLGVRISMDDFGTGYSSLSYLQSFPFDKIKIDQTFIANLDRNPQSAAIIRAVIGLGHGLGLPILAEGVETKEQLEFLARESCDEVQGYLIGHPLPIADYAEILGRPPIVRTRKKLAGVK
jgi:diguanylate cyclase (GGDEF)-like protein/PAS domain S-box-containing protein